MTSEFWHDVMRWIVAGLMAVFAWMFRDVHSRIKEARELAESMLSKEAFGGHLERSERDRAELRRDVRDLFERDDKMKDLMQEKFEDLRREMHDGIERLSREIRTREGRA